MKKLVIISIILLITVPGIYPQVKRVTGNVSLEDETRSLISINKEEKKSLLKNQEDNLLLKTETEYRNYIQQNIIQQSVHEDNSLNLVSSFRKNVRFGGIWSGYAVVNFTPNMFIQPVGFISIYASHNFRNFIHMKSLKENIKPLIIEGAAILAIDISSKYLFSFNKIVQSLVSFTAKNIFINMIKEPGVKKKNLGEYKSYFYSIIIKL